MGDRILKIAAAVLGAVLVIGVLTFAGPCVHDDGSVSTCHGASVGIIVAGVVVVLAGIVSLIVKNKAAAGAALIVAAIAGAAAALAPGVLFPLCMMDTMRCHLVMQPFAQFLGAATAAVALIAGIRAFRAEG